MFYLEHKAEYMYWLLKFKKMSCELECRTWTYMYYEYVQRWKEQIPYSRWPCSIGQNVLCIIHKCTLTAKVGISLFACVSSFNLNSEFGDMCDASHQDVGKTNKEISLFWSHNPVQVRRYVFMNETRKVHYNYGHLCDARHRDICLVATFSYFGPVGP